MGQDHIAHHGEGREITGTSDQEIALFFFPDVPLWLARDGTVRLSHSKPDKQHHVTVGVTESWACLQPACP